MDRALSILDILREIFAHLIQPDKWTNEEKSSFAALARTCKTFYEPAMDLLWSQIHGIEPLLGCVPRLHPLIYCRRRDMRMTLQSWSQGVDPLSEHEARQFLRHATRIRSLNIWSDEHFHLLTVLPIETCVFPRLLVLSLDLNIIYLPGYSGHLQLFLSPMLRRCQLPVLHPDLKSIATCCPNLENLSIQNFGTNIGYMADGLSMLSDAICSCSRLVDLHCPYLDFVAWKHLSNLPTLLALRIDEDEPDAPEHHPMNWDNLYFPRFVNLTTLIFDVKTSTDVLKIMQHSEFPSLKVFEMVVDFLPWTEAEPFFHALSMCKACETLKSIYISSYNEDDDDDEFSDRHLMAVRQLFCFPQLQTLRLSVNYLYLDNYLLVEAISSWPHIRSLELWDTRCFPPPSTITFGGLFAALRGCPYLHTLRLSMDTATIDIDPTTESFQHTSLKYLNLCESDAADPEAVALIVSSMLPCVEGVHYNDFEQNNPTWDEVNDLLLEFAAREQF